MTTIHRRRSRPLAIALLAVGITTGSASADPSFPSVSGDNLDGKSYQLPADLEGDVNLLLVAFQRDQQAEIDTWIAAGEELESRVPGFRFYELPVIGQGYRFMRGVIEGGMRSGISDPSARARTITLFVDKASLTESVGIDSERTIHALLVDREGRVLWHGEGGYDETAGAALGRALAGR
jgi:hypothetical protein